MTLKELEEFFPDIGDYLAMLGLDRGTHAIELFILILKAANGNKKEAVAVFRILYHLNIRCVADFDCARLLNLKNEKNVGIVRGKILTNMFSIRLMETLRSANVVIPLEKVLEFETEREDQPCPPSKK